MDDGSTDRTLALLKQIQLKDDKVKLICFSRNFGKESALFAGLENARGDFVVVMDADLQHPPQKIVEMLAGIEERI